VEHLKAKGAPMLTEVTVENLAGVSSRSHWRLTYSVYKVVLQKSMRAQIRQRILYHHQYEE
jgi:hypothetical protein